jgi:hypothetical protein
MDPDSQMPSDVSHGSAAPIPPTLFDVVVGFPEASADPDVSPPAATAYRALLLMQDATGGGAVTTSGATPAATERRGKP